MKGKKLLIYIFVISIFLCFPLIAGAPARILGDDYHIEVYKESMEKQKEEANVAYELATKKLTATVSSYIQRYGEGSKLSASLVIKKCDQYDVDLKLVLAQGYLESQFGTMGRAKFTNSVFNVGALDDGTTVPKNIYTHPNYSVEPYIQLLKSQYLIKGKTENDLLYGKFVNKSGKRYASDRAYEKRLIHIISQMNPDIDSLIIVREYSDSVANHYDKILQQFNNELLAQL